MLSRLTGPNAQVEVGSQTEAFMLSHEAVSGRSVRHTMRPLQHVHLVVECEGKLKRLEVLDLSFRFN